MKKKTKLGQGLLKGMKEAVAKEKKAKRIYDLSWPILPTKGNKKLRAAAKKAVKEIEHHFKKDGWPLDYRFYKDEIFYYAFGEHLENYLIEALSKKKGYYLRTEDGKFLIDKRNKK